MDDPFYRLFSCERFRGLKRELIDPLEVLPPLPHLSTMFVAFPRPRNPPQARP